MADNLPPFPLSCAPEECLRLIAEPLVVPGPTDFQIFGQRLDSACDLRLGFTTPYLKSLSSGYLILPNGPAREVLRVASDKGVTIQVVYRVLRSLNLEVANVLKEYVPEIRRNYERMMNNGHIPVGHVGRCPCDNCIGNWSVSSPSYNGVHHNAPVSTPYERNAHVNGPVNNTRLPPATAGHSAVSSHRQPQFVGDNAHLSLSCYNRCEGTNEHNPLRYANCSPSRQNVEIHNAPRNQTSSRQLPVTTTMNNLSMPEYPPSRNPNIPHPMNISSQGQTSAANGVNHHTSGDDLSNFNFLPPSDDEEEDEDVNCISCEASRLTNSDETEKKLVKGTQVTSTCNQCCVRNTNHHRSTSYESTRDCTCPRDDQRRYSGSDVPSEDSSSNMQRRLSRSQELNSSENLSCTCGPVHVNPQPDNNRIFVSFSDYGINHLKEVFALINRLQHLGFNVKCDMYQHKLHERLSHSDLASSMSNVNDWLLDNFTRARFVVFCITPLYYEQTKPCVDENVTYTHTLQTNSVSQAVHPSSADVQPSEDHLHTKFLYTQAQSEYMNNLTRNRRFLPVVFTNSGANRRNHVPAIFNATTVYSYPDVEYLMGFLESLRNQRQ